VLIVEMTVTATAGPGLFQSGTEVGHAVHHANSQKQHEKYNMMQSPSSPLRDRPKYMGVQRITYPRKNAYRIQST
ncbi:unnamed protein product, partial [Clavelina lepadiformis]